MKNYSYTTRGTCCRKINFSLEDGKIYNLVFTGGCSGNTQAIAKLLEGTDARRASDILRGNDCAGRGTSCADQLAIALDLALERARNATVAVAAAAQE